MIRDLSFPFLFLVLAAFMLFGTQLSHDVSWYLISTRWWLNGVPVYQEILELNPPLAFYLTVPPVWMAERFGLSDTLTYQAYVFFLSFMSLLMTQRIMSGDRSLPDWMRIGFLTSAALALVIVPMGDFGQREHLFVIFLLPYLALVLVNYRASKSQRLLIAVWATFGIALKHYFVLIPLVLLIHRLIVERSFKPILRIEYTVPALLLILYVAACFIFHPAYFADVIPLTFQVYGAYDIRFAVVLAQIGLTGAALLGLLLLKLLNGGGTQKTTSLLLVVFAALAIYLIQSKGWQYHRIPFAVCSTLALSWAALEFARLRQHWWPFVPAVLALGLFLVPVINHGPYRNATFYHVAQHFTCPAGARTVQVFSAKVSHSFPMANYAQAEPSNRAPALWLFPGAARLLEQTSDPVMQQQYQATLDQARDLALEDFFRTNPQLVVVDTRADKTYFNGAKFEYLDFFTEVPAFSDAWNKYELVGKVYDLEIYRRPGCDV